MAVIQYPMDQERLHALFHGRRFLALLLAEGRQSGPGAVHQGGVEKALQFTRRAPGQIPDDLLENVPRRLVLYLPPSGVIFDDALQKTFHLGFRRGQGYIDLEHLGEVVLGLFLIDAHFVVVVDHQAIDHLAIDTDHEDEIRNVEIEF